MVFPNAAITDDGYHTLINAMRHEWAANDLDEADRVLMVRTALGYPRPTISAAALQARQTEAALALAVGTTWDQCPILDAGVDLVCENV